MRGRELRQKPESLVEEIIRSVANCKGVDAMELPPLYGQIDPEALERLCESAAGDGFAVTFTFCDCLVEVRGEGEVTVEPTDGPFDANGEPHRASR